MPVPETTHHGPATQRLVGESAVALAQIATWTLANNADDTDRLTAALSRIRDGATAEIAAIAAVVTRLDHAPEQEFKAADALRHIWQVFGRYNEMRRQLDQSPFTVKSMPDGGTTVEDIRILTRRARIPPEAGKLKMEIDDVINVVDTVMADRVRRYSPLLSPFTLDEIRRQRSTYLESLLGIAQVGLETNEPTRIAFARDDLRRVTGLFTLREAGVVKNAYINRLFVWSALAALVFGLLFLLSQDQGAANPLPWRRMAYDLRNFHLLAAGTAIGTWLSFSLRKQELAFADLAVLEKDRVEPAARVLFMVGLSLIAGLLLYTGAVIAGIGAAKGFEGMHGHGATALLFGLLAGVAERTLGNVVSQRSQEFGAILGKPPGPAAARD